jgi:phosphatidate cytidylyltransferase
MAFSTRTFMTRTASAAVFVVLLLGCLWLHPVTFVGFFAFVGFVGLFELYKLAHAVSKSPAAPLGYFLHAALLTGLFLVEVVQPLQLRPYLITLTLAWPLYMLVELFKLKTSLFSVPAFVFGFLYVSVPCALLILMSGAHFELADMKGDFHPQKVLGMIFFIWINDTGAYLVGSFLGKHKMYERVSPGKTWEGTIGGVILTLALAYVVYLLFPQLAYVHWLAIALIVSVFGTLGDLAESLLKRTAQVKDSGRIMPGHGGVLDRFDSLLFATPFVFAYLAATGNL